MSAVLHRPIWLAAIALALASPSSGEVTTDGSLSPTGTRVTIDGPDMMVPSELGLISGENLFHSLDTLDVPSASTATFTRGGFAGPIRNVITRVTGGPSEIDGTLRSTIGEQAFFLINPAGLVFGEGSQVDVSGSFFLSTATQLGFGDGTTLATADAAPPVTLSADDPVAFGFLGAATTGSIDFSGVVKVEPGRGIHFVGGDITISGQGGGFLAAPGGRIDLVSVASSGTVRRSLGTQDPMVLEGFSQLGDIVIRDDAIVDVSSLPPDFVFFPGLARTGGSPSLVDLVFRCQPDCLADFGSFDPSSSSRETC